jgi:hypothetical protein
LVALSFIGRKFAFSRAAGVSFFLKWVDRGESCKDGRHIVER